MAWRKTIVTMVGLLVVPAAVMACGNGGAGRDAAAGLGAGQAGGAAAGGAAAGGAAAPRDPVAGGANAPGAPGNTALPGAPGGPPAGAATRPQPPPADLATGVNELNQTFGVQVRGAFTKADVDQTLVWARSFKPEETKGVTFTFTATRKQSGVLGVWNTTGQSEIYSDKQDVVFHEGVHHISLFPRNTRSKQVAEQVFQAAVAEGGGQNPAANTITRSYAQTNSAEWKAEFFTGLAGLERGVPLTFTQRNSAFNPSEKVRAIARTLYNN